MKAHLSLDALTNFDSSFTPWPVDAPIFDPGGIVVVLCREEGESCSNKTLNYKMMIT